MTNVKDHLDALIEDAVIERSKKEDAIARWKRRKSLKEKRVKLVYWCIGTAACIVGVCLVCWYPSSDTNAPLIVQKGKIKQTEARDTLIEIINATKRPQRDNMSSTSVYNRASIEDTFSNDTVSIKELPTDTISGYEYLWNQIQQFIKDGKTKHAVILLQSFKQQKGVHQQEADSLYNKLK